MADIKITTKTAYSAICRHCNKSVKDMRGYTAWFDTREEAKEALANHEEYCAHNPSKIASCSTCLYMSNPRGLFHWYADCGKHGITNVGQETRCGDYRYAPPPKEIEINICIE